MIWTTVWTGRMTSVMVSPLSLRIHLHMSLRFDVFFLNLLVNVFTGNLLVIIWMRCRLSSVLIFEDFRYLLMDVRQLGSRIRKSVVLVEVSGSVWV